MAVSNTELMNRLKTAKGAQKRAIQTPLRARASALPVGHATRNALLGAAKGGRGGGGGGRGQRRDSKGRFA